MTNKEPKACEKKFIQLYEGDGLLITEESNEFRFKCCSCGLVHLIKIEHTDEGIVLRFHSEDDKDG